MKVLHCIYTLGGGGAERQLSYLAARMADDGIDTHVVFMHDGPNMDRLMNSSAILHRLPQRGKYDLRILIDLNNTIRKLKPHIIQTWLTQMDILAGSLAWIRGIPLVVAERSAAMAYPNTMRNRMRCLVGRTARFIVANSEQGGNYWKQIGFSGDIAIIRNGIDLDGMRRSTPCSVLPTAERRSLAAEEKLILFAGRYSEEKNLETLLEAFSYVLGRMEGTSAVLFGAGPMIDRMWSMHSALPHRDRLYILPYTENLWRYMARADVVVSMSVFEGNPNVVLEAAALNCPLVLSDIPQHREIADDKAAVFVPPHDPIAAAEGVIQVLSDRQGALLRARHAHERIADWSIKNAARRYVALYNGLLS